jgi:hypothetical protein
MVALAALMLAATASAQEVKPYKEGSVTSLSYIRTKPGKFDEYMKFLDTTYKTLMDANKKAGLVIGYAVYAASPRSPKEPDIILSVSYANWAAFDKVDEADAVAAKVIGPTTVQSKGAIDREALREVLGGEVIQELILK